METESRRVEPVRGTQSFVRTLSECWRRPSLTALEVSWRWTFGVPAGVLVTYEALRVLRENPVDIDALKRMSLLNPLGMSETLGTAASVLLPAATHIAIWLAPLLLMAWIVVSSLGRGMVLRRVDQQLHARPGTLILLQTLRMGALIGSFAVWFACLRMAARATVTGPIASGQEANLVLYSAITIVTTLGLFTLWAVASWVLSAAPLLAMRGDLGAGESLRTAFQLGPVRSKLVEINLVMGIVKIALIVLAMVASSCPLPFQTVATPEFMTWWYAGVVVAYLVASDFFHVVRLVSYLEMWKAYNSGYLLSHTA